MILPMFSRRLTFVLWLAGAVAAGVTFTPARAQSPTGIAGDDAGAVRRGVDQCFSSYPNIGVAGLIEEINGCYASLPARADWKRYDYCAALDRCARNLDSGASSITGWAGYPPLAHNEVRRRQIKAASKYGMTSAQSLARIDKIEIRVNREFARKNAEAAVK